MAKKVKTKEKKKNGQEDKDILKKLNRVELLELLLEQTKRVEELEEQLTQTKRELEQKDIKLREVVNMARQSMDMVDKEADRRAELKIKKVMAENKASTVESAVKQKTSAAAKPAAKSVVEPTHNINFFDAAGQVDVAKILSRK